MNRLSPLIVRATRSTMKLRPAMVGPQVEAAVAAPLHAPGWLQDLRLFASAWACGFVFFSTFIA